MEQKEILVKALKNSVVGMARGVAVVDENVTSIVKHLQKKNIRVYTPDSGLQDNDPQFEKLIAGRIFITANPKDFIDRIPELDVGLISVEHVYQKTLPDLLAQQISKVIREQKLFTKRHGFLVTMKTTGVEYTDDFD